MARVRYQLNSFKVVGIGLNSLKNSMQFVERGLSTWLKIYFN